MAVTSSASSSKNPLIIIAFSKFDNKNIIYGMDMDMDLDMDGGVSDQLSLSL